MLKDWKQTYPRGNKGDYIENLIVYKKEDGTELAIGTSFEDKWGVATKNKWEDNPTYLKHFKNKSQALKFAKAYMKNH
jgi:hypothetical protein